MVVGEAPGETEDKDGIPFVGESGVLLAKKLRAAGINLRRDCWITNAARCRPPKNRIEDKHIEACRPNVLREIREKKPDVILLCGASAVKSVIGSVWKEAVGPLERWVGWRIPCQSLNAWLCPTYHPAYLLRSKDPALELHFGRHLKAVSELEGKPWETVPDWAQHIAVEYDPVYAANWLRLIGRKGGTVAFDYETNCLKPDSEHAGIWSCSVCWRGEKTVAFPWVGEAVVAMGELLADPSVKKIAHNMKFEERWTRKQFGHGVKGWEWDTMLAAHLLDNRRQICSLKFQSFVRMGVSSYDDSVAPYLKAENSRASNRIREANLRDVLLYNGMDALLTYDLAMKQKGEFE